MTDADKEIQELKNDALRLLITSNQEAQSIHNSTITETLKRIENHVIKTNGRVSKLEDQSSNCPGLNKVKDRVYKLEKWQWKSIGYISGAFMAVTLLFKYVL